MRSFSTAGPVKPAKHYCIPPLSRIDLDDVLGMVRDEKYFVLHAPRQTGKTSALLALADLLNERGYHCLYVTLETARAARDDVARAMRSVLGRLASGARAKLADKLREERVRRVIEPLLIGADRYELTEHDVGYARDLGLIARDAPVRIANPIYAEVLPRELSWVAQETLDLSPPRYVKADRRLNVALLLAEFQSFFRRHSEHWRNRFAYEEALFHQRRGEGPSPVDVWGM